MSEKAKARRSIVRRLITAALAAASVYASSPAAMASSQSGGAPGSPAKTVVSDGGDSRNTQFSPDETSDGARVVRVAFPHQNGLTEVDADGNYSGYTYEYLMEIAQYTGWEYEFVTPESTSLDAGLSEMLEMLKNGELDIIGGIRKNEDTEKLYDLSAYHYGTSSVTLSVLETNTALNPANYYSKSDLRVAVLEGATRQNKLLEQFCAVNNFSPSLVYAGGEEEQLQMLRDGGAELMLGRDLSPIPGTRTIAKFSPEPFFFALSKNSPRLLNQLNHALLSIETLNPNFSATLFKKYFTPKSTVGLLLSDREREFIRNTGPLTVGLVPGRSALQSLDPATGVASGITVDIMNEFARRTGLLVNYESVNTLDGFEFAAASGRYDIVLGMDYDYDTAKSYNVIMSPAIFSVPYVRVASFSKTPKSDKLGFTQNMKHIKELREYEDVAVFLPNSGDALAAVNSGELAAAYMDSYTAQKLITDRNYRSLTLAPVPGEQSRICMGVARNADRTLSSIVNKTISSFSEQEITAMIYANTLSPQPMTLWQFLTIYPVESVVFISVFMLLVIMLMFFMLRRTTRLKNALASNNRRYIQLCELVRELVCEYDFSRDTLTISGEQSTWLFATPVYKDFLRGNLSSETECPTIEQILARLIFDRASGEVTLLCTLPTSDERWLCINHHTSMNDDGSPDFFICKLTDVSENMRELEKLTEKAQTDTLTRLYNLDAFRALVNDALAAKSPSVSGVFMIMDIDRFKSINDTFGHFEGDVVLKGVADALRGAFRETDFTARLGGDEFVAFSPGLTDKNLIAAKCRDIMTRCGQISEAIPVTMSLGVALFQSRASFDELYKLADAALYRAKEAGRNGYDIGTLEG